VQRIANPKWSYDATFSVDGRLTTQGRLSQLLRKQKARDQGVEEDDQRVMSMLAAGLVWVGLRQGVLAGFGAVSKRQIFCFTGYHKDALSCILAISCRHRHPSFLFCFCCEASFLDTPSAAYTRIGCLPSNNDCSIKRRHRLEEKQKQTKQTRKKRKMRRVSKR